MNKEKDLEGNNLVFGLDIGTRSIVGTAGYKDGEDFIVVSQHVKEHESRAMLDGQIHDIRKVGESILDVKELLEKDIGSSLKDVCIAAAGRVLRTVTTHVELTLENERPVKEEDIFELASMGIEKAYGEFQAENDLQIAFYCVGYSVIRYYQNGFLMSNLEEHKAKTIGADLIATFLPEDVVDGLYRAVEIAGLEVANMTLEPIAAISLAIPERFRLLNIALVDVGAGTSDISITKDGSIVAYGMIPMAGDALTEVVAHHCLVEFSEAEKIKRAAMEGGSIDFVDIMGLPQTIQSSEVIEAAFPVINRMTGEISDKIKELNGDKPVSAVFVVGGGGKFPGFTKELADKLGIQRERVALRGKEVMDKIIFKDTSIEKDSLLVTPVGICLSFYEQSNNFIFVTFNGKRQKIYDNSKLAVVDVAMQVKYPNDKLFPKRGKELNYRVNGNAKIQRGQMGEAALITVNGQEADMNTPVRANDVIVVKESTAGAAAHLEIGKLPECRESISVLVNDKKVVLPKFASVNGQLQSEFYDIQEGDEILFLPYYTVRQIIEFMDVVLEPGMYIYVNNKRADYDTQVYDNFALIWTLEDLKLSDVEEDKKKAEEAALRAQSYADLADDDGEMEKLEKKREQEEKEKEKEQEETDASEQDSAEEEGETEQPAIKEPFDLTVQVNGESVTLTGKNRYVFVNIFDYIDFNLAQPKGRGIVTDINGRPAQFNEPLSEGDVLDIYWKE
ncbi:MAG: rod shape-determining protein [Lachnospiraceae bacterium]|nr:rod shape-determining protein [Lachnospiraceae bacterium]